MNSNFTGTSDYKMVTKLIQAPCQNCGKLVTIHVPFIGCIFCSDCAGGRTVAYMFGLHLLTSMGD